jgi:UDP-N-acetylglucosamine transferase subunit ALG13
MLGGGALIFVTVGSLFPFDRLIQAADKVAAAHPELEFFAQVGESELKPAHMPHARLLSRGDFKALTARAKVIVAHAGMGSIITAMELGIPIIIVPRRFDLGEHNTDHQAATARSLADREGLLVCEDEARLGEMILEALRRGGSGQLMSRAAPKPFTDRIAGWIRQPARA